MLGVCAWSQCVVVHGLKVGQRVDPRDLDSSLLVGRARRELAILATAREEKRNIVILFNGNPFTCSGNNCDRL
jgi:hypothetical protein